jgi:hypothetical protein
MNRDFRIDDQDLPFEATTKACDENRTPLLSGSHSFIEQK